MRLGGSKNIPVDVRVIAATNKDLQDLGGKGEFRQDLFFRLNVFPLRVPALRERPEDIPLLAKHFLDDFCRRNTLGAKSLGEKAVAKLKAHPWPGNVRELKNLMERLAIVVESAEISEDDVSTQFCVQRPAGGDPFVQCKTYEDFKNLSERMFLESRLKANDWNVSKTAEDIGMPRSTLYKKLEKYGILVQDPG
jgi:two-component system nitrogen regulation response regulator NtrX